MPEYLVSPVPDPSGPYSKSTADALVRSGPKTASGPLVAVSSKMP